MKYVSQLIITIRKLDNRVELEQLIGEPRYIFPGAGLERLTNSGKKVIPDQVERYIVNGCAVELRFEGGQLESIVGWPEVTAWEKNILASENKKTLASLPKDGLDHVVMFHMRYLTEMDHGTRGRTLRVLASALMSDDEELSIDVLNQYIGEPDLELVRSKHATNYGYYFEEEGKKCLLLAHTRNGLVMSFSNNTLDAIDLSSYNHYSETSLHEKPSDD